MEMWHLGHKNNVYAVCIKYIKGRFVSLSDTNFQTSTAALGDLTGCCWIRVHGEGGDSFQTHCVHAH